MMHPIEPHIFHSASEVTFMTSAFTYSNCSQEPYTGFMNYFHHIVVSIDNLDRIIIRHYSADKM